MELSIPVIPVPGHLPDTVGVEPRIDKHFILCIKNPDLTIEPVNLFLLIDIMFIWDPAVVTEPGQLGWVYEGGDGYGVLLQARLGV